jgi:hypothetical protein
MSNELNPATNFAEPLVYQIRLKGQLGSDWAEWFGGVTITPEDNGTTLLTGPAIDQAALHGLLKKVRDLGLTLLSVNPIEPDRAEVTLADPNQSVTKGTEE